MLYDTWEIVQASNVSITCPRSWFRRRRTKHHQSDRFYWFATWSSAMEQLHRTRCTAFSPVTFNTVLHRPKKYASCGSIKITPTRGEGTLWLIYWRGSKRLENRRTNEQQFVICSGVDDSHLWRDYDLVAISFRLHGLLGDATCCIPKPLVKTIPTFWIILFPGVLMTWAQDWDNYLIT